MSELPPVILSEPSWAPEPCRLCRGPIDSREGVVKAFDPIDDQYHSYHPACRETEVRLARTVA